MKKMLTALALVAVVFGAWADSEKVGDYTWYYRINGDTAEIYEEIYEVDPEGWWITSAISPSPTGAVTIPSTLGGKPVTCIGSCAFRDCHRLTSVTIPANVTSIGNSAFWGCRGLTNVTIGTGVMSIGYYAFYDCSGLLSVTIPDSVTSIGGLAFSGCSGLTSVTIPDSVTSIGDSAFSGCSGLTSVTIGNGVTSIEAEAFTGCPKLLYDKDSIPGVILLDGWAIGNDGTVSGVLDLTGIRGIGGAAFSGCNRLTSVVIPNRMTSIGSSTFSDCSGLTSVTIPDSVTSIGDAAFSGCSGLTSVTIPDSVTNIGVGAFQNCSSLTNVTIGTGVVSIQGGWFGTEKAFSGCSQLLYDKTSIPGVLLVDGWAVGNDGTLTGELALTGIRGIACAAFFECRRLTGVRLPDSVIGIGEMAFAECSGLTRVTIPAGVTRIEGAAFAGCSGLTNLTFLGNAPDIYDNSLYAYVFDDVNENCTAYVRHDSTGWGVTIPGTWNGIKIAYSINDVTTSICGDKTVTVPGAWLEAHENIFRNNGDDVSAAIQATAANERLSNVECYILGLDPEDTTNDLKIVSFPMKADGTPDLANIVIDPPEAQWNVPGARAVLKGATTLDGDWKPIEDATAEEKAAMRFFKVVVELP